MKKNLIQFLCCPNCEGEINVGNVTESASDQIIVAILICNKCNSTFNVNEGIPILLPSKFSNNNECQLRKAVSEKADMNFDELISTYNKHHFYKLAALRINKYLNRLSNDKPKVLDIGIGWGVNYTNFTEKIDLWGLDFSFESLVLLKKFYEDLNLTIPTLICGSLSAIPIKKYRFDLIWSTQVYQHIPEVAEIEKSLNKILFDLIETKGILIIDNLNYSFTKFILLLKSIKKRKILIFQENYLLEYYIKYYKKIDYLQLLEQYKNIEIKIRYSELMFHPEIKILPHSNFISKLDWLVSKTFLAKYLGRQISCELIINK